MHASKRRKCTTPTVQCKMNCEFEVIMMCQCRFISCNKCATPVGDVLTMGEAVDTGAQGVREISISSQFCSKPKTAIKK